MCDSNACCPPAQILQEKICGNFNGDGAVTPVWSAPTGGYIAGTFEIFNSASSTSKVVGQITGNPAGNITAIPGYTISQSINAPTNFTIEAPVGTSGTYCITLYRRVLA
ncbi:S-Ena type endospore appendage [Bacillus mycoides]|uniref:S-Ena type endospore appendage n=1 Tax=Bacillus mycoides TaxID=1405 RepID=UPI003D0707AA